MSLYLLNKTDYDKISKTMVVNIGNRVIFLNCSVSGE